MGHALRDNSGRPLRKSGQPQTAECSDCCGGGGPTDPQYWIELVSCQCGYVRYMQVGDGWFSCSPADGGPPPIGTVLRAYDSNDFEPGACWEVTDHLDALPDGAPIMPDDLEFQCTNGCADARCRDISVGCPPCPWDLCNGWQDWASNQCGYVTRHAYIRRLVAMAVGEQSLAFQYRFWRNGVQDSARDATITYNAMQFTTWDWDTNTNQPVFVNQTLQLVARMQYAEYGPSHGAGCSFDKTVTVSATNNVEGQWFNTVCGPLPPILSDPIRCGDEPTRLAYFPHGIVEPFSQCPEYQACVNPAVSAIFTASAYVDNQLPDDGTCLQDVVVSSQHENTIGGNGCGRILDRTVTDTRYFRPWIFTRTRRQWDETGDTYGGCGTTQPDHTYWNIQYTGSISGRGWWRVCGEPSGNVAGEGSGIQPQPFGTAPFFDPRVETYLNQDPMRRCRGCGG